MCQCVQTDLFFFHESCFFYESSSILHLFTSNQKNDAKRFAECNNNKSFNNNKVFFWYSWNVAFDIKRENMCSF